MQKIKNQLHLDQKCYLFDYEDSFTHNIASELRLRGFRVQVIELKDINSFLQHFSPKEKSIFIHGPGPGHPNEYSYLFDNIKKSFNFAHTYHVGICLGHQIFCTLWGGRVDTSKTPLHGQRTQITIPDWDIFEPEFHGQKIDVQRYNSLALAKSELKFLTHSPAMIKYYFHQDELMITSFKNGLTYQFHPESVGTSYRSLFFGTLVKYLL
jgi:anthranilate/para-aminobenzoate synthase component II